jgi:hypothetical protein
MRRAWDTSCHWQRSSTPRAGKRDGLEYRKASYIASISKEHAASSQVFASTEEQSASLEEIASVSESLAK